MTRHTVRARLMEIGIIPAIRTSSADDARFAAETILHAGIPIVEITMTVPGALEVIAEIADSMPGLIIGAGTVFEVTMAQRCMQAGAQFLTSPGLDMKIVEFALKHDLLAMPGALTPTEITRAWQAGADFIKVFPCAQVGGASYIHALKAPFAEVSLVAAGGVNQQTVAEFILAGAAAVGVGTELIPKKAVQQRDQTWISELARRFLTIIKEARERAVVRDEHRSEASSPHLMRHRGDGEPDGH
jgi:2-dehydro-3-deoxyphosphogluconate aldolase/(4S)-4-hydroxy-2-oxoglutarate aldolase